MLAARPRAGCCRRGSSVVSNQSPDSALPTACALVRTEFSPQPPQAVATLEAHTHHCSGLNCDRGPVQGRDEHKCQNPVSDPSQHFCFVPALLRGPVSPARCLLGHTGASTRAQRWLALGGGAARPAACHLSQVPRESCFRSARSCGRQDFPTPSRGEPLIEAKKMKRMYKHQNTFAHCESRVVILHFGACNENPTAEYSLQQL